MCNPTNYGSNPSVTLRQELQRELFHDAKRGDQDFTKGTITPVSSGEMHESFLKKSEPLLG